MCLLRAITPLDIVSAQIPDLRQVSVGGHVRTINGEGYILACYLPLATVQLYNGRREGDPTWQKYDTAWAKAEALKERVIAYLQKAADAQEFIVCAAGVIDASATLSTSMGEIQPALSLSKWQLPATWHFDRLRVVDRQPLLLICYNFCAA